MKFSIKCLREGIYWLVLTPLIMVSLIIAYSLGAVDQHTEVHWLILKIAEHLYSEEKLSFTIFLGILTTSLLITIIKTQKIPRHEKIRIGKINNAIAKQICNTLLFFSGVFIANSLGSKFIPFIQEINLQEFMAIYIIPCAIWIRYQMTKINHRAIGHKL